MLPQPIIEGEAMQKLAISEVLSINEPEPAIVEITVRLIDGTTAVLRTNIFVAQSLAASIGGLGM
jgi:hypothetical protein